MHPSWKESSEIAQYLESQRSLRTRGLTASPNHATNGTFQLGNIDHLLACLHRSKEVLQYVPEFSETTSDLLDFVKQVRTEIPFQSSDISFNRLDTLRRWISWLPTKLAQGSDGDLMALAVLAQLYSTALVLEPVFPGLEGSYLGCMALSSIENIEAIYYSRQARVPASQTSQLAVSLMETSRYIVQEYRTSIQWTTSPHIPQEAMHRSPHPHYQAQSPHQSIPMLPNTLRPFEYPPSPFATGTSYASPPPTILPFSHSTITSSPFQPSSHPYRSSGNFSSFYMNNTPVPSSEYYEDSLSDYSRPGTIEHSPAYSSYGNEYLQHGLPTVETTSPFQHLLHGTSSNSAPPDLGT
jgi:hypothetical protein